MKQIVNALIDSQSLIGPDTYSLQLKAPHIASYATPGQFVMVYLNKGELLLPRPISLCDVDIDTGIIHLVYVVVGKGTHVMSQWQAGETVRVMGPLGNGFVVAGQQTVALVGGGMGVPPLLYLLKQLAERGIKADAYLGFRQESTLPDLFAPLATNLHIATDDGSMGQQGTVMDLLTENAKTYDTIYSCGPIPMLKSLAAYAKTANIPCQVALEERMACGIGACKSCVVRILVGYSLCCMYGPVFDSQEVNWDA